MGKKGLGEEDNGDFELRVECKKCGKRFDFADYLTSEDEDKHIAEIVLEKCGGNDILCDKCRSEARKVLDKGKFELVSYGDKGSADIEMKTEGGAKSVWKMKSVDDNLVTFEVVKHIDLNED